MGRESASFACISTSMVYGYTTYAINLKQKKGARQGPIEGIGNDSTGLFSI